MTERQACTADNPAPRDSTYKKWKWYHPDAGEVGEQRDGWPCGDLVDYKCPHCGLFFTVELPQ